MGSVLLLAGPGGTERRPGVIWSSGLPGVEGNCSGPPPPRGVVTVLVPRPDWPPGPSGDASPTTGGSLVPPSPLVPSLLLQGEKGEPGVIISPDGTVVTAKVKGEKVGALQEWGARPCAMGAGWSRL